MRPGAGREAARRGLFRMLIGQEGLPSGRIDRPASGGAAAVWMPFDWLGPMPLLAELRGLPSMLRTTGLARFGRLHGDPRRHGPAPSDRPPHAYLWFLGVAPAAQGRGVGSALLRAANARSTPPACPPTWKPAPPATSPSTSATASR